MKGRALEANEWTRFDSYAKRIRSVRSCDVTSIVDSGCSLLLQSMAKRMDPCLLPAAITIRELQFGIGSDSQIQLAIGLLNPLANSVQFFPTYNHEAQVGPCTAFLTLRVVVAGTDPRSFCKSEWRMASAAFSSF